MRLAATLALMATAGCSNVFGADFDGYETKSAAKQLASVRVSQGRSKLDLLLVVDNSHDMSVSQSIFRESLDALIGRLVNPPCVTEDGGAEVKLSSPSEACPAQHARAYAPITDIHVGVISSSLGGHGGDFCDPQNAFFVPDQNDRAHLLPTVRSGLTSFENKGFLAWDGSTSEDGFVAAVAEHVAAVGEAGCGWEATLEAMYRFLIDPEPYDEIHRETDKAQLSGVDWTVLEQRAAFLRPDSLVAITVLSDENDCSFVDGGISWLATTVHDPLSTSDFHLPRSTSTCANDPTTSCCRSCGLNEQTPPPGCTPLSEDPSCALGAHDEASDPINLRCFKGKQRFGFDWMQPIQRYVSGLRDSLVPNRNGDAVPNPLFSDAQGKPVSRTPSDVVFGTLTGIPWQLAPSLTDDPAWLNAIGDPSGYVDPIDPHMIESRTPRPGLPGPNEPPDPISGYDFPPGLALQYACIHSLPAPIDCGIEPCICAVEELPICEGTIQTSASAAPGLRHLELARDLGNTAIVGSVCHQTSDTASPEYGYRPPLRALADRAGTQMVGCLDTPIRHDAGTLACVLVEATPGGACNCAPPRYDVEPIKAAAARAEAAQLGLGSEACVCQIGALFGSALDQCLNDTVPPDDPGWCYIANATPWSDKTIVPAVGDPSLLGGCDQRLRITPATALPAESVVLLLCAPEDVQAVPPPPGCTAGKSCSACPTFCERCLCQREGDRATCEKLLECP